MCMCGPLFTVISTNEYLTFFTQFCLYEPGIKGTFVRINPDVYN